ncbi:hypothetical protein ACTQ1U_13215, partial [Thermoguttaceae bacterium LCP21S3_D4]
AGRIAAGRGLAITYKMQVQQPTKTFCNFMQKRLAKNRFLVSLSCDCDSVFAIFKLHNGDLNDKGIYIYNLDENPQRMKNGRSIYRLKGKYEELPFELQIKSKVDSAWADIEHMLFYKDYQFSYIQNTNRNVMNKIGDLLDQIDGLMIQIRDSQQKFEGEKRELEFNRRLGERYKELLKNEIISVSILRDYRAALFGIYSQFTASDKRHIDDRMMMPVDRDTFFEFKYQEDYLNTNQVANYKKMCSKSIELLLFEHIYSDWLFETAERGQKYMDEKLFSKYFERLIISVVIVQLKFLVEANIYSADEINNYARFVYEKLYNIIKGKKIPIEDKLFIFDKNILHMFLCFWKSLSSLTNELDLFEEEEEAEKIIAYIIEYLCNSSMLPVDELIAEEEQSTSEVVKGIMSADFLERMKDEYSRLERTESGKKLKKNLIADLFELVIKKKQGE